MSDTEESVGEDEFIAIPQSLSGFPIMGNPVESRSVLRHSRDQGPDPTQDLSQSSPPGAGPSSEEPSSMSDNDFSFIGPFGKKQRMLRQGGKDMHNPESSGSDQSSSSEPQVFTPESSRGSKIGGKSKGPPKPRATVLVGFPGIRKMSASGPPTPLASVPYITRSAPASPVARRGTPSLSPSSTGKLGMPGRAHPPRSPSTPVGRYNPMSQVSQFVSQTLEMGQFIQPNPPRLLSTPPGHSAQSSPTGQHQLSPSAGHRQLSPSAGYRQLSPSAGHRQLSPSPGHRQLSPSAGHRQHALGHIQLSPSTGHKHLIQSPGQKQPSSSRNIQLSPTSVFRQLNVGQLMLAQQYPTLHGQLQAGLGQHTPPSPMRQSPTPPGQFTPPTPTRRLISHGRSMVLPPIRDEPTTEPLNLTIPGSQQASRGRPRKQAQPLERQPQPQYFQSTQEMIPAPGTFRTNIPSMSHVLPGLKSPGSKGYPALAQTLLSEPTYSQDQRGRKKQHPAPTATYTPQSSQQTPSSTALSTGMEIYAPRRPGRPRNDSYYNQGGGSTQRVQSRKELSSVEPAVTSEGGGPIALVLPQIRKQADQQQQGRKTGGTSPAGKKKYQCPDCKKEFSQLRNFRYHRSRHEGTKQFACTCPVCGKSFNDKGYLSSHLKIHRNAKEYKCEWCEKSFNQRVAYNMHIRIHTGLKPHQCHMCNKAFSRKMLLRQHLRTHTGERPYHCIVCGKSFADRSNMLLHQRLHTGDRPYKCDQCNKTFSKNHHLKTHMNHHLGIRPYHCPKCSACFSQSSNMKTHMKKCTGLKNQDSPGPSSSRPYGSPPSPVAGSSRQASSSPRRRTIPTATVTSAEPSQEELPSSRGIAPASHGSGGFFSTSRAPQSMRVAPAAPLYSGQVAAQQITSSISYFSAGVVSQFGSEGNQEFSSPSYSGYTSARMGPAQSRRFTSSSPGQSMIATSPERFSPTQSISRSQSPLAYGSYGHPVRRHPESANSYGYQPQSSITSGQLLLQQQILQQNTFLQHQAPSHSVPPTDYLTLGPNAHGYALAHHSRSHSSEAQGSRSLSIDGPRSHLAEATLSHGFQDQDHSFERQQRQQQQQYQSMRQHHQAQLPGESPQRQQQRPSASDPHSQHQYQSHK